jgi:hypothetical protein
MAGGARKPGSNARTEDDDPDDVRVKNFGELCRVVAQAGGTSLFFSYSKNRIMITQLYDEIK